MVEKPPIDPIILSRVLVCQSGQRARFWWLNFYNNLVSTLDDDDDGDDD